MDMFKSIATSRAMNNTEVISHINGMAMVSGPTVIQLSMTPTKSPVTAITSQSSDIDSSTSQMTNLIGLIIGVSIGGCIVLTLFIYYCLTERPKSAEDIDPLISSDRFVTLRV
jgi:hypothetical protein